MDNRTLALGDGLWQVEVGYSVNAFVVAVNGRDDGDGLVLVDTGPLSAGPRLVCSVRMLGLEPTAITEVVLSHWHREHAGAAARFARSSASPTVRIGADDRPVLTGSAPPGGGQEGELLSDRAHRPLAQAEQLSTAAAHTDAETLPGGLEVVAAPGHTAGHCAFWLPEGGALLAGDALMSMAGLHRPPAVLCADRAAAEASLARLAGYEPEVVAVGHGPPITRRAGRRLAAAANRRASRRVR
jgi:glyoxylase-like metal-dependent hydrolase (beta-lactamase superfamily II)